MSYNMNNTESPYAYISEPPIVKSEVRKEQTIVRTVNNQQSAPQLPEKQGSHYHDYAQVKKRSVSSPTSPDQQPVLRSYNLPHSQGQNFQTTHTYQVQNVQQNNNNMQNMQQDQQTWLQQQQQKLHQQQKEQQEWLYQQQQKKLQQQQEHLDYLEMQQQKLLMHKEKENEPFRQQHQQAINELQTIQLKQKKKSNAEDDSFGKHLLSSNQHTMIGQPQGTSTRTETHITRTYHHNDQADGLGNRSFSTSPKLSRFPTDNDTRANGNIQYNVTQMNSSGQLNSSGQFQPPRRGVSPVTPLSATPNAQYNYNTDTMSTVRSEGQRSDSTIQSSRRSVSPLPPAPPPKQRDKRSISPRPLPRDQRSASPYAFIDDSPAPPFPTSNRDFQRSVSRERSSSPYLSPTPTGNFNQSPRSPGRPSPGPFPVEQKMTTTTVQQSYTQQSGGNQKSGGGGGVNYNTQQGVNYNAQNSSGGESQQSGGFMYNAQQSGGGVNYNAQQAGGGASYNTQQSGEKVIYPSQRSGGGSTVTQQTVTSQQTFERQNTQPSPGFNRASTSPSPGFNRSAISDSQRAVSQQSGGSSGYSTTQQSGYSTSQRSEGGASYNAQQSGVGNIEVEPGDKVMYPSLLRNRSFPEFDNPDQTNINSLLDIQEFKDETPRRSPSPFPVPEKHVSISNNTTAQSQSSNSLRAENQSSRSTSAEKSSRTIIDTNQISSNAAMGANQSTNIMTDVNQSMTGANRSMTGANQSMTGANQSMTGANQSITSTNQSMTSTNQSMTGGNQSMIGGNQSMMNESQSSRTGGGQFMEMNQSSSMGGGQFSTNQSMGGDQSSRTGGGQFMDMNQSSSMGGGQFSTNQSMGGDQSSRTMTTTITNRSPSPGLPNGIIARSKAQGKADVVRNSVLGLGMSLGNVVCSRCHQGFTKDEEIVNTGKEVWHTQCFVCAQCFRSFPDGLFYEFEGRKFCEHDFNMLFAPCCGKCGEFVIGRVIKAMNASWHPHCFMCELCGMCLADSGYFRNAGRALCKPCNDRVNAADKGKYICYKCKSIIDEGLIKYKAEPYHAYHFNCTNCNIELTSDAREVSGELYCLRCHDKMGIPICGACKRPIDGERIVHALGKSWHVEHFVCAQCEKPFLGTRHYEKKGLAYCETHYHLLFGNICFVCNQIIAGDVFSALNKAWCVEHFACSVCDKKMSQKTKFYEFDLKPVCKCCYEKFPAELKKRQKKAYDNSPKK